MVDIVVAVAAKVAEYLVAPVGRQCGYVIFTNSYVGQLEKEREKLENARRRVQHLIDEARNNMKPIEADVGKWVTDVETVANKACDVPGNDGRAKKTCFYGWLPNPKARYRLGREARTTVQAIQKLIKEGRFKRVFYERAPPGLVVGTSSVDSSAGDGGDTIQERIARGQSENPPPGRAGDDGGDTIQELSAPGRFEKVDFENPPLRLLNSAPDVNLPAGDGGDPITDSRASIFQDIMKALDSEKQKVIGIHGPGGVGKTTLLEEVEKKLRKQGRPFHMIVKAKVSQTQDVNKIQDDIAFFFGLQLKDEPSEEGRRHLLCQRLQQDPSEKILIILDDLWGALDLKAVGIPLGYENVNCKLLLTSRDKSVLEQKMRADRTFHLKGLSDEEAFSLFARTVGDKLKDDEDLKAKAAQVVRKLAGLPLLITSVASALKYSNVSAWENALIKIEDPDIEKIVKWSYDHLESEDAKCLFLLCGLIGGNIEVELLLGLGMGLGLFEGFNNTVQNSRNRLNTMLHRLHSLCLLQDDGDGKENVTIHDLYSEVVVSNAFSGQNSLIINSNYGSWPKEKLEKCWACLVNVGSDRLAELMLGRFPHVKILMLLEQKDIGDCSRMHFVNMEELRALYLCSMTISSFPSSMEDLGSLQSLSINCHLGDVANLGKLKALRILNFAGSYLRILPKEIGELTNLRSLNLSHCDSLGIIEHGALKGLINLEELLMNGSFDRWSGENEIPWLVELKTLTKLTALEISIISATALFEDGDLPFGNLVRFCITIGSNWKKYEGLGSMNLNFEWCDNIIARNILSRKWVQKTLEKTQYLCLNGLREFKKSAHELCTQGFPELKCLTIYDSNSIKYIVNSSNSLPPNAFRKLESLSLIDLTDLVKICHGPIALECFSKLKVLSVEGCHQLKYLWFLLDMQRLVQLEEIEVKFCSSMQSIITHDAGKDIVSGNNRVELPKVRRLALSYLQNMTSFCAKAEITSAPIQVSLPHLESLEMVLLPGLEEILYGEPSLKYSNLREIIIKDFESTSRSIMKLDWMLNLPNLESMSLERSSSVELVFDLEELEVTEDVEILSRLTRLNLKQLPNLKHMWKQDVKLKGILILRNLRNLIVFRTGLSFLFSMSMAKCLREIRVIVVECCPNMKAVFVDEEGRDQGTYDIIEFPQLESLRIWQGPIEKFFSYPHGNKEPVTTTSDSQDANFDSFFDRKISLPNLVGLDLYKVGSFKRIWHVELQRSSFCKLATITIKECSDLLHIFPTTIIGRLHNLQSVKVKNCPSLKSLFDFGSLDSNMEQTMVLLPELVSINVESCPFLESLFNCGSIDSNVECKTVLLPKLQEVSVSGAQRLRYVVKSRSQIVLGFPNLETVGFQNCSNLRYLFSNYTATTLVKLERLNITKCKQMKEVILEEEVGRLETEVMNLPRLSELTLEKLDNLISFGSRSCSYYFCALEDLTIVGCCNFRVFIPSPTSVKMQLGETAEENDESSQPLFNEMVTFPNMRNLEIEGVPCKELWNNQIPTDSFKKLESLELKNCDNLQHIATSYMWKNLWRCLKKLKVISCRSIKIIYEVDGTYMESGKLWQLYLHDLENLRCIWQSNGLPNIPFPNLVLVEAVSCPHLEMLFPTFTAKFLGQIERLIVDSCEDMELIAGHEKRREVTGTGITFSKLTDLKLSKLPKFKSFLPEKYCLKFPCSEDFPSLQVLSIVSCGAEPDQAFDYSKKSFDEDDFCG